MCKFFTVLGLSLALLGGCGAGDTQPTESRLDQPQQSVSALTGTPSLAGPTDNVATEQAQNESSASIVDNDDRDCRQYRCEYRCRYRGCDYGYCDWGHHYSRCVCRGCDHDDD